jgi:hypothetical protein
LPPCNDFPIASAFIKKINFWLLMIIFFKKIKSPPI